MEALLLRMREQSLPYPLLVDLDLLLTDAFLTYGSHLLEGCVNPETYDLDWFAVRRESDLRTALQSALESNSVGEALEDLLPASNGYARLQMALVRYRGSASAEG